MSLDYEIFLLIIGCFPVTAIPRIMPIAILKNYAPPKWFVLWLEFLPSAIMATLVSTALLFPEQNYIVWENIYPLLVAFIPTLIVAIISNSLGITVITGIIAMYLVST